MKKSLNVFLLMALMAVFTISCDENNDPDPDPFEEPETEVLVSENISEDTTWETGKVYILGGRIAVESGVTLTIEPGVIIKGQAGTGANATALLVARGATLDAEGTEKIENLLGTLREKYTIVIVTHNMAQARRATDECMFMLLGEMIEHGETSQIFFNPTDEKTEMYIEGRYG